MSIDVQTTIRNTCLYRGGEFNVLMAMADCANTADGTGIYPGIDLLAANARQSIRQCQDNIKRLRNDGVVVLVGPGGEDFGPEVNAAGGRGCLTEYRIDLERVRELQGLHEAEKGECDFCKAREIRIYRAAKRARFSARKDAVSSAKGAASDKKGAVSRSHIEEPIEPSEEPSQSTNARERAPSGGDVSPVRKQKYSDAFERFWVEVRKWPEFTTIWSKPSAWQVWVVLDGLGELLKPGDMVAATREYGREKTRLNTAARNERKTPQHTKHPANWLRDKDFRGIHEALAELAGADGETAPRPTTIASDDVAKLRATGLGDDVIAGWFADGEFDAGPPPLFRTSSPFKAKRIMERFGRQIRMAFGDDVEVTVKQERAA